MERLSLFASVFVVSFGVSVHPARAVMYDLTGVGSAWTINGAVFQQFSDGGGGSGNIDAFVRIQATGIEQGYNTDYRPVQFNEDTSATFNHSQLLSEIPTVTDGGIPHREFLLDIDQSAQYLSLDKVEVYLEATGNIGLYPDHFTTLIYELDADEDNWVKLDYRINAGSGAGDMLMYIPDSLFQDGSGGYLGDYVYVYSMFGVNFPADNGFEEWAHGIGGPVIPEPTTVLLLGLGALFGLSKKRRRGDPPVI